VNPDFNSPTDFLYDVAMNGIRENELERAKRLGTWRKIDRTRQYEGRYSPEMLLRSDNYLWARLRKMEAVRFWRALALIAASAVSARLPEIVLWMHRLFR
jgi:hypothetical protein